MTRDEIVAGLGCTVEFVALLETERIIVVHGDDLDGTVVERIRVCWGLYEDLGVNVAGLEVVLHLLDRLDEERRLHRDTLRRLRSFES
jgi:hypothetical protein